MIAIHPFIGNLMIKDEFMLSVYGDLDVIADFYLPVVYHGPAIRIGQGDLLLATIF